MHTQLMMDDVLIEAMPWLIWSLGFMIVYMIASFADDAKEDFDEQQAMKITLSMNAIDFKIGDEK